MTSPAFIFILATVGLLPSEPPLVTNAAQIIDGHLYDTPIRVVGTVREIFRDTANDQYNFLALNCGGSLLYGGLYVTNQIESLRDLQRFIGSRVEILCRCQRRNQHYARRALGHELIGITAAHIRELAPPAQGIFDAPPLAQGVATLDAITAAEPRRIRGTVRARWNNDTMLIQTAARDSVVVTLGIPALPDLNEAVEVVGIPATDLYNSSLSQARWRPAAAKKIPTDGARKIVDATIKEIVGREGGLMINPEFHGQTIRLRGEVKGLRRRPNKSLRLTLGDDGLILDVDCSAAPQVFVRLREGCTVEVTGVFVLTCDAWRPAAPFPEIRELLLVTRAESDVAILSQPPWWTPFRFLMAVLVLGVALLVILVWNAVLRAMVTRKSKALLREQAAKLSETLKIDERTRLAAELHDNLAQNLTVVSYRIAAARSAYAAKVPATAELLASAERMLQSCRTDLRNCLWDLRSDVLDERDFAEAIRQTIRPLVEGIAVDARCAVARTALNDMTAHAILCIVRELVFNAVTHGRATEIRISGEHTGGEIRFTVADNGVGFRPDERPASRQGHFGLDGVRERLRRYDGDLQIVSNPGDGTRVTVTLRTGEPHP